MKVLNIALIVIVLVALLIALLALSSATHWAAARWRCRLWVRRTIHLWRQKRRRVAARLHRRIVPGAEVVFPTRPPSRCETGGHDLWPPARASPSAHPLASSGNAWCTAAAFDQPARPRPGTNVRRP